MGDNQVLVVIETQRVKGYLFASPILRETRGASLLLDQLNRTETKKLLENYSASLLNRTQFIGNVKVGNCETRTPLF
jgi:hypothetical protein